MIVQSLVRDNDGNMWVGTFAKGVKVFGPGKNVVATLNTDSGLPSNAVNDMMVDSRGRVWIATRKGIVRVDNPSRPSELFVIDEFPRLGSANIKAVEEDEAGNIWVSSNSGVARLHFHNDGQPIVNSYSGHHMEPLNSFIEGASTSDSSGNIYFGSVNGIYRFSSRQLGGVPSAPKGSVDLV